MFTLLKGDSTQKTQQLHERYGPIVRLAPNELSFIDAQAWQDIYTHHQGRPNFPKNLIWMAPAENGIHSILSTLLFVLFSPVKHVSRAYGRDIRLVTRRKKW